MVWTKLDKSDFKKILKQYSVGEYVSHKQFNNALSNTVYYLKTSNGKYVLKVFEDARKSFIKTQVKLMNYLKSHGLNAQTAVKTKSDELIIDFKSKPLVLFNYLEGKELKSLTNSQVKQVIKELRKVHELLSSPLTRLRFRSVDQWAHNHQFKHRDDLIDYIYKDFNLRITYEALINEASEKINKHSLKHGLIHSDIQINNFLFNKGEFTAFIDWDDMHYDYLVYDLAVFCVNYVDKSKIDLKSIKFLLDSYGGLSDNDKTAIYFFIKNRLLGIIIYQLTQACKHKSIASDLKKKATHFIRVYKKFDKISLEEFLKSCY